MSLVHETFGYYAHGVGETTAVLPEGWKDRLVKLANDNTMGAVGWCLEVHDLAASKLVAAREKDLAFVEAMLRSKIISSNTLRERLRVTPGLPDQGRQLAFARLDRWAMPA